MNGKVKNNHSQTCVYLQKMQSGFAVMLLACLLVVMGVYTLLFLSQGAQETNSSAHLFLRLLYSTCWYSLH